MVGLNKVVNKLSLAIMSVVLTQTFIFSELYVWNLLDATYLGTRRLKLTATSQCFNLWIKNTPIPKTSTVTLRAALTNPAC